MKQYAGMSLNYAKSINTGEDDDNGEYVYAELNILVTETKYELSNASAVVRTRKVDELEIIVTAESARDMAKALNDAADKMDEARDLEKERDKAHKEWMKD